MDERSIEIAVGFILAFLIGFFIGICAKTPNDKLLERYEKLLDINEIQIANEVVRWEK